MSAQLLPFVGTFPGITVTIRGATQTTDASATVSAAATGGTPKRTSDGGTGGTTMAGAQDV
jgi:hypothetical protein